MLGYWENLSRVRYYPHSGATTVSVRALFSQWRKFRKIVYIAVIASRSLNIWTGRVTFAADPNGHTDFQMGCLTGVLMHRQNAWNWQVETACALHDLVSRTARCQPFISRNIIPTSITSDHDRILRIEKRDRVERMRFPLVNFKRFGGASKSQWRKSPPLLPEFRL